MLKLRTRIFGIAFSLILLVASLLPNSSVSAATSYRVVGWLYYSNVSSNSSLLTQINFSKLTHLVIGDMAVTSSSDPTLKWIGNSYIPTIITKAHAAGCKVLHDLVAKGPDLYSLLSNSTLRSKLVTNIYNLLKSEKADGFCLDWEGDTHTQSQRQAVLGSFFSALYKVLNSEGKIIAIYCGGTHFDISVSTSQYVSWIDIGYYFANNPLTGITVAQELDSYINAWVSAGYSGSKLNIKVPLYATDSTRKVIATYANVINSLNPSSSQNTKTGLSSITPGLIPSSTSTKISGTLSWNGANFARAKVNFMKSHNLGGIMLWPLEYDKYNDSRSLLASIYDEIH